MTEREVKALRNGIYVVRWKEFSGTTLAAVGTDDAGRRWLAPTSWSAPSADYWGAVESVVQVFLPEDEFRELEILRKVFGDLILDHQVLRQAYEQGCRDAAASWESAREAGDLAAADARKAAARKELSSVMEQMRTVFGGPRPWTPTP